MTEAELAAKLREKAGQIIDEGGSADEALRLSQESRLLEENAAKSETPSAE